MTKTTATKKIASTKTTVTTTTTTTTTTMTTKTGMSIRAKQAHRAQVRRNRSAGSKKASAVAKKKGIGLFAPKTLSPALAKICGKAKLSNVEVTKAIWKYIKAKKLNAGRIISPDAELKGIFPVAKLDMLKMGSYVKKHIS